MENHGILNWRKWSTIRKAQVIGVAFGGIGTIAFSLVLGVFSDPQRMFDFPAAVQFLICLPTWLLLRSIGKESVLVGNSDHWPLAPLLLMGLVNAVLLFIVGTIAGFIIERRKNRQKTSNK